MDTFLNLLLSEFTLFEITFQFWMLAVTVLFVLWILYNIYKGRMAS